MTANNLSFSMCGIRKAAIFLAMLEKTAAGALLAQLEPDTTATIRQAVDELQDVTEEERRQVLEEFRRVRPLVPQASPAGLDLSQESNLQQTTDDQPPVQQAEPPLITFDELELCDQSMLGEMVQRCDPRVLQIALLGAKPALAERLLACLPAAEAKILRKKLAQPDPIRLSEVEEARRRLVESLWHRPAVHNRSAA